jgi:hypothetical protein
MGVWLEARYLETMKPNEVPVDAAPPLVAALMSKEQAFSLLLARSHAASSS